MFVSALRTHLPLLRTLLVLFAMLGAISLLLYSVERRTPDSRFIPSTDWQWAPASSYGEQAPPSSGWKPARRGQIVPSDVYWLRVPLPPETRSLVDPQLYVLGVGSLKVYAGGEIVFNHELKRKLNRMNIYYHWKMVPLSAPAPEEAALLIRYGNPSPLLALVAVGDKSDLLSQLLQQDLDNLVLGGLLLFSAFIALSLYLTQRDSLYLYFALLSFGGGFAAMTRNFLLQAIVDSPVLAYYHDACLPVATYAFLGLLGKVFAGVYPRALGTLRAATLLYALATVVTAIFSQRYYNYLILYFAPLFVLVFVLSYWTVWTAYRRKKAPDAIWIMAGFTLLTTVAAVHICRFILFNFLPAPVQESITWIHDLPVDLLLWSVYLFVLCLIRVILYRYTAMNRQLTDFKLSLEQIVRTRTRELQERNEQLETAHDRLAASTRENAEALAEGMILEERHRITGTIHDTVGHTLSASIIQLEAAKRLLHRDPALAEEKLEASQSLARTGLEDIRRSVRLLREDAAFFDLPGAVGALIRELRQSCGCRAEADLSRLPAGLNTLQKRLVFQMLQEILHQGGTEPPHANDAFRIVGGIEGDIAFVRLLREGSGYEAKRFGFGLQTLAESVAQLGGTLAPEATPEGVSLTLRLPGTGKRYS